jgi:hypothetical protein
MMVAPLFGFQPVLKAKSDIYTLQVRPSMGHDPNNRKWPMERGSEVQLYSGCYFRRNAHAGFGCLNLQLPHNACALPVKKSDLRNCPHPAPSCRVDRNLAL